MQEESRQTRRIHLYLIVVVLLLAAAIRITHLTRLPPGFNDEEITGIQVTETVRQGAVATLYNTGSTISGYEGLYPTLQALITSLIGDGLLCYRVLSVWCGLISVALMYSLARRLFGSLAGLGAGVALTVAFWPLLLSRSAIRETLLLPVVLGFLLTMAHALHLRRNVSPDTPVTFPYTTLGVLLIIALYVHWTGILMIPFFFLFLAYLIFTRQPISRRVLSYSGFALLVAIILGIPYLTFSFRVPALSALHAFWANRPESIGDFFLAIVRTLGGIFAIGDPLPHHNLPGFPLIAPVGSLLLLLGLFHAFRRWRAPNNLFILLALGLGLLPGIWSRGDVNFTNLVIALPALMALIGLGVSAGAEQWLRATSITTNVRVFVLGTALTVISVLLAWITLSDRWAASPAVDMAYRGRLGELAAFLDRRTDDLTTSICTLNLTAEGSKLSDPALLDLMMHRRTNNLRFSNCLNALVLTQGGARQRIAFADTIARDQLPPLFRKWLETGQVVSFDGLPPGAVLDLDVEQRLADLGGKLMMGHVEWAPEAVGVPSSTDARLPVRMGGYLTFNGYDLSANGVYKPGDTVMLTTFWRADGAVEPDLRIFAHILRNPNTEPILQNDILSVDAALLRDRDVFIQIVDIPIPDDFPPGEYQLSVGAYRSGAEARLPVFDANAERGDRLFLNTINVQE